MATISWGCTCCAKVTAKSGPMPAGSPGVKAMRKHAAIRYSHKINFKQLQNQNAASTTLSLNKLVSVNKTCLAAFGLLFN
jgi:hypothetical protein